MTLEDVQNVVERMKKRAAVHVKQYGTLVDAEIVCRKGSTIIIPAYYITRRDGKSYHLYNVNGGVNSDAK